jgi:aspartate aminotransferase
VSIARFYPEGTIISGGLSKWCGAGGWRLGTFFFPRQLRWLLDAMGAVASETYTSVSAPFQFAAVRAFQGGLDIERYLINSRRILRALAHESHRRLTAAGINVVQPAGAFYLFPDFGPLRERLARRGFSRADRLCSQLLQDTGVAILPGVEFGRPVEELTARLALVDVDGAKALVAVGALAPDIAVDTDFLEAYCAPVLEAIDRITDWATTE